MRDLYSIVLWKVKIIQKLLKTIIYMRVSCRDKNHAVYGVNRQIVT